MDLLTPTPEQGLLGLRALWTVATVDGPINPEEHAVLVAARDFTRAECDLTTLASIEPAALAEAFPADAQLRWQLSSALTLMVDISGQWDYWAVIDRPIVQLREEYNILPRREF